MQHKHFKWQVGKTSKKSKLHEKLKLSEKTIFLNPNEFDHRTLATLVKQFQRIRSKISCNPSDVNNIECILVNDSGNTNEEKEENNNENENKVPENNVICGARIKLLSNGKSKCRSRRGAQMVGTMFKSTGSEREEKDRGIASDLITQVQRMYRKVNNGKDLPVVYYNTIKPSMDFVVSPCAELDLFNSASYRVKGSGDKNDANCSMQILLTDKYGIFQKMIVTTQFQVMHLNKNSYPINYHGCRFIDSKSSARRVHLNNQYNVPFLNNNNNNNVNKNKNNNKKNHSFSFSQERVCDGCREKFNEAWAQHYQSTRHQMFLQSYNFDNLRILQQNIRVKAIKTQPKKTNTDTNNNNNNDNNNNTLLPKKIRSRRRVPKKYTTWVAGLHFSDDKKNIVADSHKSPTHNNLSLESKIQQMLKDLNTFCTSVSLDKLSRFQLKQTESKPAKVREASCTNNANGIKRTKKTVTNRHDVSLCKVKRCHCTTSDGEEDDASTCDSFSFEEKPKIDPPLRKPPDSPFVPVLMQQKWVQVPRRSKRIVIRSSVIEQ
ncbi:hypothetical protein RFI_12928 [Reticulomyxa filosa]|uniref:Uncharacterized protein n=1 Tax=Reticulomyxa filosa TaxID=46433 RepID=X6NE23_RETFI|nr:hypothetical protein RFI_12928 [Reticulomyxa filosa]|eukprot:ETO24231.1 hypothetical protein RFI_12928 [Reticulomyxa filosa]